MWNATQNCSSGVINYVSLSSTVSLAPIAQSSALHSLWRFDPERGDALMPNVAHITIAGHLGRDAESREAGHTTVTSFSIAVSDKRNDRTNWFSCSLWGTRGEKLKQYLTKGRAVLVTGGFTTREHNEKQYLDVNVDDLSFLGGGGEASSSAPRSIAPAAEEPDADIPF